MPTLRIKQKGAVGAFLNYERDRLGDTVHVGRVHTARCDCGCSEPDTARYERLLRIVRNSVLVSRDMCLIKKRLDFLTGLIERSEIKEHKVIVGAA